MVYIIAEIGINHNGSMDLCKKMILLAKVAGCDYAKIQKRTPELCVPDAQKGVIRDTPWGRMTYLEYKQRMEFTEEQIAELVAYSDSIGIPFFASVWDIPSADCMAKYTRIGKIPSALITDLELCKYAREKFDTLLVSTGMSTEEEVEACVAACKPDVIFHTNSTYPCPVDQLNLRYIQWLKANYPEVPAIGYSGHEYGLVTTFAAVAMGAEWIERHITLDRTLWGSDQTSSVEPSGLLKLVKGVRDLEAATAAAPGPRVVSHGEREKLKSLRK